MRIFLSILWGWSLASFATAQILPESGQSFHAEKFISYTEHTDSLNDIHYQVGTYNPADSPDIHLPIYLRIARQGSEKYYDLDTKYDPDMFSFPDLSSDRLVIIKGRYAFYVYDIHQQTLSRKLQPGLGQYEGEDAISGLYAGLTLFDNEKFILGNVQGFGVFCFDISDPADPVELMQYAVKKADEELPFYAFLYKTDSNLFDILCAQPDTSSKSLIPRLYKRLKTVRYVAQGIALAIDISKVSDTILKCLSLPDSQTPLSRTNHPSVRPLLYDGQRRYNYPNSHWQSPIAVHVHAVTGRISALLYPKASLREPTLL